jgi:3'(2'), 5'-bisphosphate nucleotidase
VLNIGLDFVKQVADISKRAGVEIMKIYKTDFIVDTKNDNSPVTEADQLAEALILRSIREGLTDRYPIVSEEAASNGIIPNVTDTAFWLIDPLDGTKEFINRNGEFTVNIALIENTKPILGIVHVPATGATYTGSSAGSFLELNGEEPNKIQCNTFNGNPITAMVSRSHRTADVDEYLKGYNIGNEISAGSSLKFCLLADGSGDLYPRLGRTMEWDTAAGHAVLRFAGGSVRTLEGYDLDYGKVEFENPHFIAAGPGIEIS